MQLCFYPVLENSSGSVRHCPHLGGAPIAALVQIANDSGQTVQQLQLQWDAERERSNKRVGENQRLEKDSQSPASNQGTLRRDIHSSGIARIRNHARRKDSNSM